MENIGLEYRRLAPSQISSRNFCCEAQINSNHVGAPAGGHVRKASHAASHVEHQFAREIFRAEAGTPAEGTLRALAFVGVQLRASVHLPLKTKAARVLL